MPEPSAPVAFEIDAPPVTPAVAFEIDGPPVTPTQPSDTVDVGRVFRFRGQTFELVPKISSWMMMSLGEATDPNYPGYKAAAISKQFILSTVVKADRPRLEQVLLDADPVVEEPELKKLTESLIAVFGGGGPLDTPTPSPSGAAVTVAGSGDIY